MPDPVRAVPRGREEGGACVARPVAEVSRSLELAQLARVVICYCTDVQLSVIVREKIVCVL